MLQFLRQAVSARVGEDRSVLEVRMAMLEWMKRLGMDPAFGERHLNEGFSGGEKKRNEILQMALLEPELAVLDETDSGLDIDALRVVARRRPGGARASARPLGVLLVTHYTAHPRAACARRRPRPRRRRVVEQRRPRAGRPRLEARRATSVAEVTCDRPVRHRAAAQGRLPAPRAATVHGRPIVYLDSAASSQHPRAVLDAMDDYYETTHANVHRGVYAIAEEADRRYEAARMAVGRFIGAPDPEHEVIFTKNATEAINLVAVDLGPGQPRAAATPSCSPTWSTTPTWCPG